MLPEATGKKSDLRRCSARRPPVTDTFGFSANEATRRRRRREFAPLERAKIIAPERLPEACAFTKIAPNSEISQITILTEISLTNDLKA